MLNTLNIYEDLSRYIDKQAARKITDVLGKVYEEVTQTVTKKEFNELKTIVKELAQAQKGTEERVEELAQAQKRTEERVEELAQAQKRTEERVEELAQAQKKTEKSLNSLIKEHARTRERLENMSDAVGYNLENQSYKSLPELLKRDFNIHIDGRLIRRYLPGKKKGQYIQCNIYGWGKKNGRRLLILGEAKTSLSRREISRFQKLVSKVAVLENIPTEDVIQVIVVHDVVPDIEQYARDRGIKLYWSYEL